MSVEPLHSHPRCVICAEPLETRARKCTKCDAFQDVRECSSCHMPTPAYSPRCNYCKFVEDGRACRVCGASISKSTIRCGDCQSFQNWRRWLPASQVTLALILSIISVLSAIVPPVYRYFANRSETHIRVVGTDQYQKPGANEKEPTIVVLVANNGKRASWVKSAALTFDRTINCGGGVLEVMNFDDALVMPDKPARLQFSGPMLSRLGGKSKDQILAEALKGAMATLTVVVEETDRGGEPFEARRHHKFKAETIYNWMEARVPSN